MSTPFRFYSRLSFIVTLRLLYGTGTELRANSLERKTTQLYKDSFVAWNLSLWEWNKVKQRSLDFYRADCSDVSCFYSCPREIITKQCYLVHSFDTSFYLKHCEVSALKNTVKNTWKTCIFCNVSPVLDKHSLTRF